MTFAVRICIYLLSLILVTRSDDLMCPFGKILQLCYKECIPECNDGYQCPVGCEPNDECNECASGCICPDGKSIFGDICLPSEECPDIDADDIEPVDKCSVYDNCNDCISSDPDCQWCPYEPGEVSVIGSRCRVRAANPVCPVDVQDPRNNIIIKDIDNKPFGEMVQVRPQKLTLQLRAGDPQEFTLQFQPAENFPLDVYFLLDVTGSFARSFTDTVTPLATQLVSALEGISEEYAVAFGVFGDKRAIPYALASDNINAYRTNDGLSCLNGRISDVNDCNPTISFRHTTDFSQLTTEQLQDVLGSISIHLNVDALEGGMDGLVQVLSCQEEVGWRNQSLRMLLYMSNAQFHLAGDGKVGAAFRPNPGQCELEPRTENGMNFLEYTEDRVYDYPSVYQIRQLIGETETNVIFAVSGDNPELTARFKRLYQNLADELGQFARVSLLEEDSANLINVIQTAYDDISQEVRLSVRDVNPNLDFIFTPGLGCNSDDVDVCTGVILGNNVSFNVAVNMTSCLSKTTTVVLQSTAFGNVELVIEPLCECPCKNETNVIENSTLCNDTGDLICGQCQCPPGWSGDMCQCPGDETPICGLGIDGLECSGPSHGLCDCGDCECFVQEELLATRNFTRLYFGDDCECDHLTSCQGVLTDDGDLCSGRGDCVCETDECMCTALEETTGLPYGGDLCECDPIICYNPRNQEICKYTGDNIEDFGNAVCDPCNGCMCRPGTVQESDGTCIPLPNLCDVNEECARCEKGLESEDTNCDELENCNASIYDDDIEPDGLKCSFTDSDGCNHFFYVQRTIILVENDRECPSTSGDGIGNLAWIIPVAVILGLLVLGGIILLIVLLIVCINDRLEYSHFKQDLEDANWDQQENPMYVSPQTQYSNITYRPKTKTDSIQKEKE